MIGPRLFGRMSRHLNLGRRLIGYESGGHLKRSGNLRTSPSKPHGMGGILCGDASAFGFSQQENDLDQDGSASLPTGPASVHTLDGAGPLDLWSPPPPFDGGQCPHPHGPSKHRLAKLARDTEARLASSFTQLESHQKRMEDNEESNK
ncbi:hypothetical protein O181_130649 [Austropuccinia psidii MF-1]|uniref:Uncharacterized protein n=1 Tax=Austropuccinia psidii MF-1 TaxID=1389203 RepID=A0A9Q3L485_9BASI|nr:hypothetical protein [Austropuccinia psidii MF-1]